ncbi:MAG TPA: XylR N-terminal domain-containing protein, partial [Nannocystis sp.]
MKVSELDLSIALSFRPQEGKLLLGRERMLVFRQQAFAQLRELLHGFMGTKLAQALLMQFGYHCGRGDYETLSTMYPWDSDADRLGAGPAMHAWEGIVLVEPQHAEFDRARGHFDFRGLWKNSYEAETYLERFGPAKEPVCYSLCGYGSGWCSAFFGAPVLEIERQCVGAGDPVCAWEIKPIDEWGPVADPWRHALHSTETSVSRELQDKLKIIEAQRTAIAELSSPIIQVWDQVLALPVIGALDDERAANMTARMLDAVQKTRTRHALIDLTGVAQVDTRSAGHLVTLIRALGLLGCKCYLCGISPTVASTIVTVGIDLREVQTFGTLAAALGTALGELGVRVER